MNRKIDFAITLLDRVAVGFQSKRFETEISDILVSEKGTNFSFVVKVCDNDSFQTTKRSAFFETMKSVITFQGYAKLPIMVMLVNIEKGEADCFMALSWCNDIPIIEDNPKMWNFNESNWANIRNQLLVSDKTIRMISSNTFKIIKTVRFAENNNIYEIVYLRDFSPTYKMMRNQNQLSIEEKNRRLLWGIPEEDYPCDELDKCILCSLQKEYSITNVNVNTTTLLFNTELKDIKARYQGKSCGEIFLYFLLNKTERVYRSNMQKNAIKLSVYPKLGRIGNKTYLKYIYVDFLKNSPERYQDVLIKLSTIQDVSSLWL